jgi:hypothetical protein
MAPAQTSGIDHPRRKSVPLASVVVPRRGAAASATLRAHVSVLGEAFISQGTIVDQCNCARASCTEAMVNSSAAATEQAAVDTWRKVWLMRRLVYVLRVARGHLLVGFCARPRLLG